MKKTILTIALLYSCGSAHALYYCTDTQGKTSFQDAPCPELPTNSANGPLAAKEVTKKVALDTVVRYNQAVSRRDVDSSIAFIASNFVGMRLDATGPKVNANQMKAGIERIIHGMGHLQAKVNCAEPVLNADGTATVDCKANSNVAFHARSGEAEGNEIYTVSIEDGKAKLSKLQTRDFKTSSTVDAKK